jgi:Xaa-Pro aminopeptidase
MTPNPLVNLRERLAANGSDAFFSLAPAPNQYLTGFRGSTSAVVVTADRAHFLCDFRYAEQARETVSGYEVEVVEGSLHRRAGALLTELGARAAVFEPAYLLVSEHSAVCEAYQGETRPVPDLVSGLRVIKSPGEIQAIREALRLSEEVYAEVIDGLREGVTESEVAARLEHGFRTRGASGTSFPPIVLFGERSSLPHGEPGQRALKQGDIVLADFGCRLDGYCSDLTRTCCFGTIPGMWFREVYDLVLGAQRAAIGAIKPGMPCKEADAVARERIRAAGFGEHFGHGLGHGLGIEIHESPRLNTQSDTLIEPGMVVTVEPGVYLPGQGGVRIEDVVVITESGCEELSSAPREFRILNA